MGTVPAPHGRYRHTLFDEVISFLVILTMSALMTFLIGALMLGQR